MAETSQVQNLDQTGEAETQEGWKLTPLGDLLVSVRNGLSRRQNRERGLYPVTRIETIADDRIDPVRVGYLDSVSREEIESYRLQAGDILLSHINSEPQLGRTVLYEGEPPFLLHGMNLLRLRSDPEKVRPDFLDYALKFHRAIGSFVGLASRAVGQSSINQGKLRTLPILLPPLEEQQAIARVLRTVQRAKEATEKVIAATRVLKRSLMRHVFAYGPVAVSRTHQIPLKDTDIGSIPAHWPVGGIGDNALECQYGLNNRALQAGRYAILRMNNLQDGCIDSRDLKYLDLDEAAWNKFRLQSGDLLFNRTNSPDLVGKTAIFEQTGDFVFASYLIRLRPDPEEINSHYLNYYLNVPEVQARLRSLAARGVSQSNINATKLRGFQIPAAPIDEQRAIVKILRAIDRDIDTERQRLGALAAVFGSLLADLVSGSRRLSHSHDNCARTEWP